MLHAPKIDALLQKHCCTTILQVLHVEGNSDLAALPDLEALENLKMLHVDEALAETLPASLKKLIK